MTTTRAERRTSALSILVAPTVGAGNIAISSAPAFSALECTSVVKSVWEETRHRTKLTCLAASEPRAKIMVRARESFIVVVCMYGIIIDRLLFVVFRERSGDEGELDHQALYTNCRPRCGYSASIRSMGLIREILRIMTSHRDILKHTAYNEVSKCSMCFAQLVPVADEGS